MAGQTCAFYKNDYRAQMKEGEEVKMHFKFPLFFSDGEMFSITFVKSSLPPDKNLEKGHVCC